MKKEGAKGIETVAGWGWKAEWGDLINQYEEDIPQINQPTNQSTNQSINQSINHLIRKDENGRARLLCALDEGHVRGAARDVLRARGN